MFLYSLTLQKPTAITYAAYGNFSAPKVQEIVVARGHILELLRPDDTGRVTSILSTDVFGTIRSVTTFRLTGANRDYVILGTDSGRIVIVEYNATRNVFEKIHQETFGRSGSRRISPGQYLAADPRGRAVMIAAVEKQKLVYILNRDSSTRLTISSPLEAHKNHTLCWGIAGLDVGFDNPIFACLELEYNLIDEDHTGAALREAEKQLTFYELDLGLNHVVRKWYETVDRSSNYLIPVPGGSDGPGGVIVCSENYISYRNQNHPAVRAALPRRVGSPADRGLLVVTHATHKQKDMFFFLLQTEVGDLYKVSMQHHDDKVSAMFVSYFDSIPTASSLALLRSGHLFAASEFGNHALYEFISLGEDIKVESDEPTFFQPHSLTNLSELSTVDSMSPVMDLKIMDALQEEVPQLYAFCGRGPRSALRVLRHGLQTTEVAGSPLPGNPSAVWSIKTHETDEFDRYIVVSFVNATIVLSIGESVEEVSDSGLLSNTPTLHVSLLGADSLMQVHPNGIRHIRADKRINEWKVPPRKTITKCSSNGRQVLIALTGGDIIYFELDPTGQLMEVQQLELATEISSLDVAPLTQGEIRARFAAVGTNSNIVRIFSLDPRSVLSELTMQAQPAVPCAVCIAEMPGPDGAPTLYLNIGLQNGVLIRNTVDSLSGQLSDSRQRFLGARAIKLFRVVVNGFNGVLALSARTFVSYVYQGRYLTTPLSCQALEYASGFSAEVAGEGLCVVSGNMFSILRIEQYGEQFNQKVIPLRYTPRKCLLYEPTGQFIILETDHNVVSRNIRDRETEDQKMDMDGAQPAAAAPTDNEVGTPQAGAGRWGSCIRVMTPQTGETTQLLELDENEAAFSISTVHFPERGSELYVAVGTAQDMTLHPRNARKAFIHLYRVVNGALEFIHKTEVEDVPYALANFQGRLLAGVGKMLRIYDYGKKKLLRKCENKNFPSFIVSLCVIADRIIVGDISESFMYVKYSKTDNQLYAFADHTSPRWLTAQTRLDFDTMAGADKFGNFFITRLPHEVNEDLNEDPTGNLYKWERGMLNGAPHKLVDLCNFYLGDIINSMSKGALVPGGSESIIYSTLMGSIGAVHPFSSREDVDFFTHLEMHMRQEHPPLSGRDHLSYRSMYFPVKNVIDGDLCEQYLTLEPSKQQSIAEELDRTPNEVAKKLEDIRNRIL